MLYMSNLRRYLTTIAIFSAAMIVNSTRINAQSFVCGTELTQAQINAQLQALQNPSGNQRSVIGEIRRDFSVLAHVISDDSGNYGISVNGLNNLMNDVNAAFAPLKATFTICEIDSIENFNYRYVWSDQQSDPENQILNYKPKVINIYFVDSIASGAGGYAYFPGGPDIVVVTLDLGSGGLIHELGHFFGLYHTFEDRFGIEYANGSNCTVTGDLLCDTEADPDGDTDSTCNLLQPVIDPLGDWYDAPTDNYMSYYDCACRFTKEQYDRMYSQYINSRSYLR